VGTWDIPFYDVAVGPDLARGELRGHAKGVIAIGDLATGFLALGGLARGAIAIGGLAAGLVSFGGLSIGVLSAVGGFAAERFFAEHGLASLCQSGRSDVERRD
jgi:hypothetical protein